MPGVDITTPLTDQELSEIVDSVARAVINKRLEMPTVLFLEIHKPLSFIASQAVFVGMPFLAPLVGPQRMADFAKLISKRENIDMLISCIEKKAAERE